ncbi:MAG: relaxase/mobilization nuclease domain-containing protein [Pseudomonadota bacterium]
MNAARGAPKAFFKRQKTGGCTTRAGLRGQLAYVNDKAEAVFISSRHPFEDGEILDDAEAEALIDRWAATWRGTTKHGFTSHMMISFPAGTDVNAVAEIAQDWAHELFESQDYGDHWDHVIAIHSDTDHPHAHIILNNRGRIFGTWFSCWSGGIFSPQLMREKQAEIAERYGIAFDASSRLERGLFTKAAPVEEVFAAKAEGRRAVEIAMTPEEEAVAHAAMIELAPATHAIGDMVAASDKADLAASIHRLAEALEQGPGHAFEPDKEIPMSDVMTVGEAIETAEESIRLLATHAATLEGVARAQFEAETAELMGELAQFTPDAEMRTAYTTDLDAPRPPGAGILGGEITEESRSVARAYAEEMGLDADLLDARLEAGGTTNAGLAQAWIDSDTAAIAARSGVALHDLDTEEIDGIRAAIDEYYHHLHGVTSEVREEIAASLDDTDLDAREAADWLQERAGDLQTRELTPGEAEAFARDLEGNLQTAIGSEGLDDLARGNPEALAGAVPNEIDRILLTQEYLEVTAVAHPERLAFSKALDPALEAATLREEAFADHERIAEANAIAAAEELGVAQADAGDRDDGTSRQSRDLDDDLEF